MNLRQQQTDITDYYKKFTDMKNLVDEMIGDYFMGGTIDKHIPILLIAVSKGIE